MNMDVCETWEGPQMMMWKISEKQNKVTINSVLFCFSFLLLPAVFLEKAKRCASAMESACPRQAPAQRAPAALLGKDSGGVCLSITHAGQDLHTRAAATPRPNCPARLWRHLPCVLSIRSLGARQFKRQSRAHLRLNDLY